MKKERLLATVAFNTLAILLLITWLCYAEQGKDEDEFKMIAEETNSLLSQGEGLINKQSFDQVFDKEMKKQQFRLNALIIRLRQFTINYPASIYTDDAAYISASFWVSIPEKYVEELRAFIEKYPKASLELFTLDNLQSLSLFHKEIGVIDAVKMDISQTLYHLARYEEAAKEAREVIDDLNMRSLSSNGYRLLSLNYYYLMKAYEAQEKNEQVVKVCSEAIEKIPNVKDKESFVKKLQEVDSVSKQQTVY